MKVFGNYGLKALRKNKNIITDNHPWDGKSYMYDDNGYVTGFNNNPRVYDKWSDHNSFGFNNNSTYLFYGDTMYRFTTHRNSLNNYYYIQFPTYHRLLGFVYRKWHYILDPYEARTRGIYTKIDYPTRFKVLGSAYLLQVPTIDAGLSWLSQPQINLDYILTIASHPCAHNMFISPSTIYGYNA